MVIDQGASAIDIEALLQVFWAEADENLATMEAGLLSLEERPNDAETLALVLRAAHTIKGNAGTFGLAAIFALAHAVEDVLADLRVGALPATPARVTLLRRATGALRDLLALGAAGPTELVGPYHELRGCLQATRRTGNHDFPADTRSARTTVARQG